MQTWRLGRLVVIGALAALGALAAPLGLAATEVRAQAQQPKLECNKSVDWQIFWVATNVPPTPLAFPFEGAAGQIITFQFNTRGPLWYNDHLSAQLYAPNGAFIWPDPNGYYWLPQSGTYSIGVYGISNAAINESTVVAQRTTMPFTIALRCTAPPATPTPAPTPPPAPTATPTPTEDG